jgi:hypothetical protein
VEHAAFESVDDELLKDLGRLVVNFGFVEFLLDMHLGLKLFPLSGEARAALISPLPTHRKVELLRAGQRAIPRDDVRSLVARACDLISECAGPRNDVLHGIWGYDGYSPGGFPICISLKKTKGHRAPDDVRGNADKAAIASRLLADALMVDQDHRRSGAPERLLLQLAR